MAKPKRTARRTRPTPMDKYEFFVSADLTAGFVAVGPRGGFSDGTVRHFLKCTDKDVCLYSLAPNAAACTQMYGPHRVMDACYPKCHNDAHMVRKCKGCGRGSVELTPPAPADMAKERPPMMIVSCIGHAPIEYTPAPDWVATTTSGAMIGLYYTGDGCFKERTQDAGGDVTVGMVSFEFVKA